jgi:hypothetical protein
MISVVLELRLNASIVTVGAAFQEGKCVCASTYSLFRYIIVGILTSMSVNEMWRVKTNSNISYLIIS